MIPLGVLNTNTVHRERIDVQNKTISISLVASKCDGGRATT